MQKREPQFRTDRDLMQSSHRPPRISSRAAALAGPDTRAVEGASQMAVENSRPPRKKSARRTVGIRRWVTWTMGGAVAMSGFIVVLWLTGPATAPLTPAITILTNATVSDATSLMAAVQTAGLRGTSDVKGAIEEIKRLDDERVTIKGWVTDATAPGSALTVIAFAGGKHVLTTATNGARVDLARVFGLSEAGVTNMSFQGAFACRTGEKIIVVAVTSSRAYSQFRSLACP